MCGIAGVVAWDDRYRTSRETLGKMSAAIAHRGPDGEGIWFNHESEITEGRPQAAFAFRRLAILDPDPRSMQPFTIGSKTLVFNGEIYNFRELRKELTQLHPDYAWRTTGDTEVLLVAYEMWGEKCVEHLNGMFAFAVWDEQKKAIFLARDRMGQKPLYITAGSLGETFSPTDLRQDQYGQFDFVAFASEPTALLTLPGIDRRPDPLAVSQYLKFGCNTWTIYESVGCVRPGTTRNVARASVEDQNYFDPSGFLPNEITDADAVEQTRRLVLGAVERQLVSDVPLGIFLSGGVDSSIIALCARKFGQAKTFSIGFDDPQYDESTYASAVAKHLGTAHYEFRVTPSAVVDLPKLAAVFGTPFGDSSALPTHYLSRETRKHVTVALSGDGGDELFAGYDRYRAMRLARRLQPFATGVTESLGRLSRGGHPKSALSRVGRFLATLGESSGRRYESYIRIFDNQLIAELFREAPPELPAATLARLFEHLHPGRDDVQSALAVDRITYLRDDLLTKVDRCSMLHGLEVRSPFMDHELVQFAAGLTTDQLLKGGPKRMLREAFAADLPDFVFKRKKMGFAVPIGEWFRGELRPMLRDHLFASDSFASAHFNRPVVERLVNEHEQYRVDHSQRLYALLMLELWWKLQKVSAV